MSKAVQVWQIPLQVPEATVHTYAECLSVDERSRADRFVFPDDRRRFIVARGTLRHLISQPFACAPDRISFSYGEYGKPRIETMGSAVDSAVQTMTAAAPDHCDFHFNMSHSGELALCALGYTHKVGIDIEKFKDIQRLDSMMERCLVLREQDEVKATDNPLRAFLTHWTCKEAYLKAIGVGLSQPMTAVEVKITPPQLVCVPDNCIEGWSLHKVDVPEGYVGAVVVAGSAPVELHHWEHPSS